MVSTTLVALALAGAGATADAEAVAALDTQYQAAVEKNDVEGMAHILHADMVLVTGRGHVYTRQDLLDESRAKKDVYEIQAEEPGTQKVRVYGDTAVVTALLHIKGTREGGKIDYRVWFSDTYVRTKDGWKYFFGQASLRLPD